MPNELWIDDVIGQGYFSEGVTAKRVRADLEKLDRKQRLQLRINSPGGDVFEGVAIRSILADWEKGYDVRVDGLAASAATFFLGKDTRVTMARGSRIMIHNPWSVAVGDAHDMRHTADLLDGIALDLIRDYAEKSGRSEKEIREALDAETWMSVDEALAFGLADEALGEGAEARAMTVPSVLGFKHVPSDVAVVDVLGTAKMRHAAAVAAGDKHAEAEALTVLARCMPAVAAMKRRIDLAKARAAG